MMDALVVIGSRGKKKENEISSAHDTDKSWGLEDEHKQLEHEGVCGIARQKPKDANYSMKGIYCKLKKY